MARTLDEIFGSGVSATVAPSSGGARSLDEIFPGSKITAPTSPVVASTVPLRGKISGFLNNVAETNYDAWAGLIKGGGETLNILSGSGQWLLKNTIGKLLGAPDKPTVQIPEKYLKASNSTQEAFKSIEQIAEFFIIPETKVVKAPLAAKVLYEGSRMAIPTAVQTKGDVKDTLMNAGIGAAFPIVGKAFSILRKPVSNILTKVKPAASGLSGTLASRATGIEKETFSSIWKNPESYTLAKLSQNTPEKLADDIFRMIAEKKDELSDTGKLYGKLRATKSTVASPRISAFPIGEMGAAATKSIETKSNAPLMEAIARAKTKSISLDGFLKDKFNLIVKDGKITASSSSVTRNKSDIKAIQNFYDDWNKGVKDDFYLGAKNTIPGRFTTDEFLNMRKDLTEMSKFDMVSGKTKDSDTIAKAIRKKLNDLFRPEITETVMYKGKATTLKQLDDLFTKAKEAFDDVAKDYYKRDGSLKESAVTSLSLIKENSKRLKKLKELFPDSDIAERITQLRYMKDIAKASIRFGGGSSGTGLQLSAAVLGNIPLFVGSLLATDPRFAVFLIATASKAKGFLLDGKKAEAILKMAGSIAAKLQSGRALDKAEVLLVATLTQIIKEDKVEDLPRKSLDEIFKPIETKKVPETTKNLTPKKVGKEKIYDELLKQRGHSTVGDVLKEAQDYVK